MSKKRKTPKTAINPAVDALDQLRPGMPAKDNIQKVVKFGRFKILKTTEMDAYDPVPSPNKKPGPRT